MGKKKKIIVVEDELEFAKMVKLRLMSAGYDVFIASDAYSGTQEIIKGDYDLIVLDLMMPAGGGFSILERIRMIPSKAMIPVIIMTGKSIDDEVRKKSRELGVSAIFSKPYESEKFLKEIENLLFDKNEGAVIDE